VLACWLAGCWNIHTRAEKKTFGEAGSGTTTPGTSRTTIERNSDIGGRAGFVWALTSTTALTFGERSQPRRNALPTGCNLQSPALRRRFGLGRDLPPEPENKARDSRTASRLPFLKGIAFSCEH